MTKRIQYNGGNITPVLFPLTIDDNAIVVVPNEGIKIMAMSCGVPEGRIEVAEEATC